MSDSTHSVPEGEGWVTDPVALDTIWELKAMQDGDEVWLSHHARISDHWRDHPLGLYGEPIYQQDEIHLWSWRRILGSPEKMYDGTPVASHGKHGFHMRRVLIIAWRRPLTAKHTEEV